jgi:hypothetical protein
MNWRITFEKDGKRGVTIVSGEDQVSAKKQIRDAVIHDIRPVDFYDRIFEWLQNRRSCTRCSRSRLAIMRGLCRRCQRETEKLKQKRRADRMLLADRREKENADHAAARYDQMGWVRVGNSFFDPGSIRGVEAFESRGAFRGMLGEPIYGWDVHLFHGGICRTGFSSPQEAAEYFTYVKCRVPHLQIIQQQNLTFWWVSF